MKVGGVRPMPLKAIEKETLAYVSQFYSSATCQTCEQKAVGPNKLDVCAKFYSAC